MTIKPWLGALFAVTAAGSGCQPAVALAPFRARPDAVAPADLLGPYDGRVTDAGSGKPIDGAVVVASWSVRLGHGLSGPGPAVVVTVDTNADGRYRIPRLDRGVNYHALVERFTLVVYQRGYVAWRSDRRFADLSPRTEFTQGGNQVRLERLPADVSHARHLAYAGAGGPLLPRLEWELPLAAEELAPSAEAAPRPSDAEVETHLDGRILLSADELRAVSGYKGEFAVAPLADVPSSPGYDSVHFKAVGQGERFDAAIRVWKLPPEAALEKLEQLGRELPAAQTGKEVGDRSLRSKEGDLLAVGALDEARGVVVLFTCGAGLCADHAQAAALVRRMWGRIGRMGQVRSAPAPAPASPLPPGPLLIPLTPAPAPSLIPPPGRLGPAAPRPATPQKPRPGAPSRGRGAR